MTIYRSLMLLLGTKSLKRLLKKVRVYRFFKMFFKFFLTLNFRSFNDAYYKNRFNNLILGLKIDFSIETFSN